ncbi:MULTISPECIES: hypothetical protein [unclassified Pseudomonas]|uniref:hypothetical protein n=1 Tax=unclassified Pseudomonas TaxID=196821 RepID=UPI001112DC1C|nr:MULTISPECIES: hypothetical protein [unclassified Pseudomonas]
MPAGFQSFTDSGNTQIDGDWKNFALVDKLGVVSVNTRFESFYFNGVQFRSPNTTDLIFFHCASDMAIVSIRLEGGGRTFYVATKVEGIAVTVFVFRSQSPTDSRSGFQVFDAAGTLVFDANSRYAKISGMLPPQPLNGGEKYQMVGGRTYAVMYPTWYGRVQQSVSVGAPIAPWIVYTDFSAPSVRCMSDGVQAGPSFSYGFVEVPWYDPTPPPSSDTYYEGTGFVVADVTGY